MKPSMSIEARRNLSAAMLGKEMPEEVKKKLLGASERKKFPPKCNRCNSRDANMCARYNMTCFVARDTICFKKYMKRREHPDYIKKVKHAV